MERESNMRFISAGRGEPNPVKKVNLDRHQKRLLKMDPSLIQFVKLSTLCTKDRKWIEKQLEKEHIDVNTGRKWRTVNLGYCLTCEEVL
jgi:hypothetical protein